MLVRNTLRSLSVGACVLGMLIVAGWKAESCVATAPVEPVCAAPADCEGLPHVACEGAWSCQSGACAWTCKGPTPSTCTADADCGKGQKCYGQTIYCIKAPCPQPDKKCVPETFCNTPADCANLGEPAIECANAGWVCKENTCSQACGIKPNTSWYLGCGAPVCQGWSPKADVPLCQTEKEGAACATPGATCDPQDSCNALLVCATSDPKAGPCPKSTRASKEDIRYLGPNGLQEVADRLRAMRLATWTYKDAPGDKPHLGFIIEDDPTSPAVASSGRTVDLYGLLGMTVGALQVQAAEIERLRAELEGLRATLPSSAPMCVR